MKPVSWNIVVNPHFRPFKAGNLRQQGEVLSTALTPPNKPQPPPSRLIGFRGYLPQSHIPSSITQKQSLQPLFLAPQVPHFGRAIPLCSELYLANMR